MNQLSNSSNRFPDCVFLKLHSEPLLTSSSLIATSASTPVRASGKVDLKLTIRFGKQEIGVPSVRSSVWFGLRRGELRLEITNGKMPLETIGLKAEFAKEIEVEVGSEMGRETELNLAGALGIKDKGTIKRSDKAKQKFYQCHSKGTETEPVWEFEVKTERPPILEGQLTEERLGTVESLNAPCHLRATFMVRRQRDVYLIESEGLFRVENLSRDQLAIIEREFFNRFIKSRLQPYLSQVEEQL